MSYIAVCRPGCTNEAATPLPPYPPFWTGGGGVPVDPLAPYVFCPPIPATAIAGSPDATVTVTGQNLPLTATIMMGADAIAPLPGQSATSISFTAPHAAQAAAGVETITVMDGATAIPQVCQFTYTAAALLQITCPVVPASVIFGTTPDLQITVRGVNITPTTVVLMDGNPIPSVYVSPTEIKGTVPSSTETAVRTAAIGLRDAGYTATVTCPFDFLALIVPTITAVFPDYIGREGPVVEITVIGTNFQADSQIVANRLTVVPTVVVSATELKGTFDPDVMMVGGHQMRVANGPLTNQSPTYVVCNCVWNPTVAMMDFPSMPSGGSTPLTVTVVGDNYGDTAKVLVDGVEVPTVRLSGGALTFDMPPEPLPVVRQISVRLGHAHAELPSGHDNVLVVVPPLSIPFTYT